MRYLRRWGESGFTLMEVLVAAAILVIVIGAVYGTFRAGNQTDILMQEDADLHQTARILLGRINSELCSIYNMSGQTTSSLTGEDAESLGNPPHFDKLQFSTVSHTPLGSAAKRGDVCSVTYAANCDSDGTPLGLYLAEDFTPGLHASDDESTYLEYMRLSDLVVGMECSYLDADKEEWVDEWVDRTALPAAVRVELILKSPRKDSKAISVACTTNLPSEENAQTSETESVSPQEGGG